MSKSRKPLVLPPPPTSSSKLEQPETGAPEHVVHQNLLTGHSLTPETTAKLTKKPLKHIPKIGTFFNATTMSKAASAAGNSPPPAETREQLFQVQTGRGAGFYRTCDY